MDLSFLVSVVPNYDSFNIIRNIYIGYLSASKSQGWGLSGLSLLSRYEIEVTLENENKKTLGKSKTIIGIEPRNMQTIPRGVTTEVFIKNITISDITDILKVSITKVNGKTLKSISESNYINTLLSGLIIKPLQKKLKLGRSDFWRRRFCGTQFQDRTFG
jgi:hypothetical protein